MTTEASNGIRSTLIDDPDMVELIAMFVEDTPCKVQFFQEMLDNANWGELKRAAHQLKGSAGGYGFACLTPVASNLEQLAAQGTDAKKIAEAVDEVIRHLQALRAD